MIAVENRMSHSLYMLRTERRARSDLDFHRAPRPVPLPQMDVALCVNWYGPLPRALLRDTIEIPFAAQEDLLSGDSR